MLTWPERYRERDYTDEGNPFLHMSLHIALEEQLSIDQPPGITTLYEKMFLKFKGRHATLHEALDCLATTIWRAQREGRPPDAGAYLSCLEEKCQ